MCENEVSPEVPRSAAGLLRVLTASQSGGSRRSRQFASEEDRSNRTGALRAPARGESWAQGSISSPGLGWTEAGIWVRGKAERSRSRSEIKADGGQLRRVTSQQEPSWGPVAVPEGGLEEPAQLDGLHICPWLTAVSPQASQRWE